jgi:hypothetical protein
MRSWPSATHVHRHRRVEEYVLICRESCAYVPMSGSGVRHPVSAPNGAPRGRRAPRRSKQWRPAIAAEPEDCDKLVTRPRRQTGETSPDLRGSGPHVRRIPTAAAAGGCGISFDLSLSHLLGAGVSQSHMLSLSSAHQPSLMGGFAAASGAEVRYAYSKSRPAPASDRLSHSATARRQKIGLATSGAGAEVARRAGAIPSWGSRRSCL